MASSLSLRGHGPVYDPDFLGRGIQTQALSHGEYRFCDGWVNLLAEGHENGLAAVGPLHAQTNTASGLDAPQVVQQA